MSNTIAQYVADERHHTWPVRLIPPLAEQFSVYGDEATSSRAREWALRNQYLLVEGLPECPHGLYGMGLCPGRCRSYGLDHTQMWFHHTPGRTPELFILTQPYGDHHRTLTQLVDAHGLHLERHQWDGWYGHGTTPYRLVADLGTQMWPVTDRLLTTITSWPVRWPDQR